MQNAPILAIIICGLFVGISVDHPFLRRILHNKRRRHYQRHPLSIELRHLAPEAQPNAMTVWSPFKADTDYFNPSQKPFMFNYRVENLVELLKVLKEEGVEVVGEIQEFPYGKFGWIMDPDGNKIELWEPKDDGF